MIEKLESIGQSHLLKFWATLGKDQQHQLKSQIDFLNILIYKQLHEGWLNRNSFINNSISPLKHYFNSGNLENQLKGRRLISQGQCGCVLIAGGLGTRLKFHGPKGMFPVTLVKKKSLFQLFAEKTLAAGLQAKCILPLAIMTSPATHAMTINFFQEHDLFGLKKDQLFFFCQSEIPLLDESGHLFLEDKGRIATGPDGNGSVFKCFVDSGIWDNWYSKGVRYLTTVLVDNPLADPFDAELVGFHSEVGGDVVVKCTARLNAEERVGVLGIKNGKIQVIEYFELYHEEREEKLLDGSLKHPCANLSLFSFTMDFFKQAGPWYNQMPFHLVHKASNYLDSQGIVKHSSQPNAWKFEKFIFDILSFTSKVTILNYPREYCFSPLKNKEGPDSIETVQKALQNLDRLTLREINGKEPPVLPFELSQQFYYPTTDLRLKWKNKPLINPGFIEA